MADRGCDLPCPGTGSGGGPGAGVWPYSGGVSSNPMLAAIGSRRETTERERISSLGNVDTSCSIFSWLAAQEIASFKNLSVTGLHPRFPIPTEHRQGTVGSYTHAQKKNNSGVPQATTNKQHRRVSKKSNTGQRLHSAVSTVPAGGGDEAAGDGGLGMQGGGGRAAADGNGTPADASRTLGRESESRKRKAAVVPTEFDYLMGNEGDFNAPSEDSCRISKEIENLGSQLALKKKELKCYQQNKNLRVELDLKVKEVECLRKENEELKAQNKDLQNNIVEILDSQIESKKRHLQQTESWKTRLELSNARLEEEINNLYEGNSEETCCLMSHPTCSNVLKATLEDEVHNLKARDEDHLKEIADLRKQLHVLNQEVKDFSERCKSLEIEMITKNDEIDRLCNDLTAKRQGKALIEKSCAAILESFESKSTAAIKASSDAVKAFCPENVSLKHGNIQGYFKWMESSFEDLRQAAYLSGYADAMISA